MKQDGKTLPQPPQAPIAFLSPQGLWKPSLTHLLFEMHSNIGCFFFVEKRRMGKIGHPFFHCLEQMRESKAERKKNFEKKLRQNAPFSAPRVVLVHTARACLDAGRRKGVNL